MSADSTLQNNINQFRNSTLDMNNYNEIYNLNSYVYNINVQEKTRLAKTNDTLKSSITKARQDYMLADRQIQSGSFKANAICMSIVTMCSMFLLVGLNMLGKLPSFLLYLLISVILVIYLIVILLSMMNNRERRNVNWNQFYWSAIERK